jgi:hypothetical protein
MKKNSPLVLLCAVLLVLASCGKEKSIETLGATPGAPSGNGNGNGSGNGGGGNSNGTEVADWKFVSMRVVTTETMEFDMMGMATKMITSSDYTTDNNAGTFKFDGTTMSTTGFAFSVNTQQKVAMYSGGQLVTTQNMPFTGDLPSTSENHGYKKIGTDSLYFAGGVTIGLSSVGSVDTRPAGYKLKWDGDKLYMTLNITETSNGDYNGITAKITEKYSYVTTLQKQ